MSEINRKYNGVNWVKHPSDGTLNEEYRKMKKSDNERYQEVCRQLLEYAELENDELSETVQALCYLYRREGLLEKSFYAELKKELDEQLKNYKENCEIVEREETRVIKYTELVWRN